MAASLMRNFKYSVSISEGFGVMGFSAVNGLTREVEVIEYREGGEATTMRKFPGQTSFGNITLERGFTTDSDLVQWMNDSFEMGRNIAPGFDNRRTVTITVLDPNGKVQRKFVLKNCFVASREIGDLDATGNEILIESLEIAHEGFHEFVYDDDGNGRVPAL
jgi:phage tail-like protein